MTRVAVVAHAGKSIEGGLPQLRRTLADHGVDDPLWAEVDKSRRAPKQIKRLLDEGANLFFVWGGDGMAQRSGPNYRELVGHFTVRRLGEVVGVMEPSKRTFPSRSMGTTQSALMTRGVSQLYLTLGEPGPDGSIAVRLYYKPLVLLIWIGPLVMVFGGMLSLSDRRLRIGAPRPARSKARLAAAE